MKNILNAINDSIDKLKKIEEIKKEIKIIQSKIIQEVTKVDIPLINFDSTVRINKYEPLRIKFSFIFEEKILKVNLILFESREGILINEDIILLSLIENTFEVNNSLIEKNITEVDNILQSLIQIRKEA